MREFTTNRLLFIIALIILYIHTVFEIDLWSILVGLIVIALIIGIIMITAKSAIAEAEAAKHEAKRRAEEEAERERVRARDAALRTRSLAKLEQLVSDAQSSAARLPLFVSEAELALDRAEQEFSDGLYSPFWEAMEDAVQHLARFEETLRSLEAARNQHQHYAPGLESDAVPFSLGLSVLPDTAVTTRRMKALYRSAQKDPHFAQVYEQRRTNAILIQGFRSLGDALTSFGSRLESQLEALGSQLDFRLSDIQTALAETAEQLKEQHDALLQAAREWQAETHSANTDLAIAAREYAQQAQKDALARRACEAETLEMLDNIQRRRLSPNRRTGDGQY